LDLLYRIFRDQYIPLQYAIVAICVLGVSALLTPAVRALAFRLGALAPVRKRDTHTVPTPRLGGVAIYLAFAIGILLFEPLTGVRPDAISRQPINAGHLLDQMRGLLLGATVAVVVGLIDDLRMPDGLPAGLHFLGQLLAAGTALLAGLRPVQGIANPLSNHLFYAHPEKHQQILLLGPIGVIFTLFWIVGMMNTVNFLDGLDGLAAGVVAIAAVLLAIWSGRTHDVGFGPLLGSEVLVLPPLILAAALLGFLCFNWPPARIFMGDAGAQVAGFIIGALAILGPAKVGTALLILAIPILDIAWVFVRRGRRFAQADAGHLHHQLRRLGWSTRRIVLCFYALCIALGLADLLLQQVGKLIAFLVVAAITAVILARIATQRAPAEVAQSSPPAPVPQR
jgi:UDP-GlcNAc:undecaprenyl-phosphate GlcNAc-1-phosphate transferase